MWLIALSVQYVRIVSGKQLVTKAARSWALHAGVLAGATLAVRLDRSLQRRRKVDTPLTVGIVAAGWYAIVAHTERRHPYRTDWANERDDDIPTDQAFVGATFALSLVTQPIGAAIARRVGLDGQLRRLPTPVGVALAVLAYDLPHTLHHRIAHEWGPAWRYHSVHHSPTRLHWLNANRFHVAELLFDGLIDATLISALGLSREQHVGYLSVRALYGQVQHCNVELESGILNRVFSTPDLHRWHHSTDYDEGDTNFGAITSLWDQLLGTYFEPNQPFNGAVGVGRMPEFPTTFMELQRAPGKWEQIKQTNAATWFRDAV